MTRSLLAAAALLISCSAPALAGGQTYELGLNHDFGRDIIVNQAVAQSVVVQVVNGSDGNTLSARPRTEASNEVDLDSFLTFRSGPRCSFQGKVKVCRGY